MLDILLRASTRREIEEEEEDLIGRVEHRSLNSHCTSRPSLLLRAFRKAGIDTAHEGCSPRVLLQPFQQKFTKIYQIILQILKVLLHNIVDLKKTL